MKSIARDDEPGSLFVLLLLGEAAFPAEIDRRRRLAGEIVVVQVQDAGLSESRLAVVQVDDVEPAAIRRPADVLDVPVRLGEDRSSLAGLQIVQEDGRLDLVVEGVAQAALVDGDGVAAIGRDGQLADPIAIIRQSRHFLGRRPQRGTDAPAVRAARLRRRWYRPFLP